MIYCLKNQQKTLIWKEKLLKTKDLILLLTAQIVKD